MSIGMTQEHSCYCRLFGCCYGANLIFIKKGEKLLCKRSDKQIWSVNSCCFKELHTYTKGAQLC